MGYKATPITYKACKSPLKADASLIYGAGDAAKKFVDVGSTMKEGIESVNNRRSNYTTFDQTGNEETNEETKDKGGQADKAVDPDKQ